FDDPTRGADDDAIATDKQPLLPGQTASFANYTSYNRGINGLMVDVENLAGTPTAQDFEFAIGNSDDISTWQPLAAVPAISVQPGAGINDSDRISLIWPDFSITKTWLQVTVKATANTGLANADD